MNVLHINKSSMLSIGSILRGIYRIDRYLSSGGFGNTYVATNVEFEEVVAIKEFFIKGVTERDTNNTTVSVSNSENKNLFEEQLQKFKKEARRLRRLKSPHIVSVHDLFEENGTAYYVMDYIDGENLAEKLKRLQQPLSETEVMGYLPQILDALECVHQEGIWHLDLKPANIMMDREGNVTLIDFGASKQHSSAGGTTTPTAVSYTNGFAPREQMEQNLDKFGPWTDLYALGATLYNLLANKKPPMPSDIDDDRSVDKHLALPFHSGVSEKTRKLILWLMTTDRLDRPQSVDKVKEMIKDLEYEVDENTMVLDVDEETKVIADRSQKGTPNKTNTGLKVHEQNPFVSTELENSKKTEYKTKTKEKKNSSGIYGIAFLSFAFVLVLVGVLLYNSNVETTNNVYDEGVPFSDKEETRWVVEPIDSVAATENVEDATAADAALKAVEEAAEEEVSTDAAVDDAAKAVEAAKAAVEAAAATEAVEDAKDAAAEAVDAAAEKVKAALGK